MSNDHRSLRQVSYDKLLLLVDNHHDAERFFIWRHVNNFVWKNDFLEIISLMKNGLMSEKDW